MNIFPFAQVLLKRQNTPWKSQSFEEHLPSVTQTIYEIMKNSFPTYLVKKKIPTVIYYDFDWCGQEEYMVFVEVPTALADQTKLTYENEGWIFEMQPINSANMRRTILQNPDSIFLIDVNTSSDLKRIEFDEFETRQSQRGCINGEIRKCRERKQIKMRQFKEGLCVVETPQKNKEEVLKDKLLAAPMKTKKTEKRTSQKHYDLRRQPASTKKLQVTLYQWYYTKKDTHDMII